MTRHRPWAIPLVLRAGIGIASKRVMTRVYVVLLAFSAFIQIAFGLAFLVAPDRVITLGGVPWQPFLTGMTVNLGCLVLLCGALSVQSLLWIRANEPAGYRLADALGAMLILLGALEGAHGMWIPLVGDGGRGALLAALAILRPRA
jgi:hypothetical protein